MSLDDSILNRSIDYNPQRPPEQFLKEVPARWVVYLMSDADDRPVQLLCVKNLRYSLKRRLGEEQNDGPTRRVDYRQLVRRIHWRRVDSAFEADVVYLQAARKYFPQTYRGMTGFSPAWFIHINPDANFPRYTKTIDLNAKSGILIGPVEDKHAAAKLIENTQDWFDLCRYYHILVQAPDALACAYKQIGKCPAPCDGSISMDNYRRMIQWSADTIVAPQEMIRENTMRMKQAAAELNFEAAGKIKNYIDSLSQLGKGPFRYVRKLRDFQYVAIQRGPRDNTAKIFLVTPGNVEEILGVIDSINATDVLRWALTVAADRGAVDSLDQAGAERVGVATFHLFQPKAAHGAFLPMETIDENAITRAFRDVQKQKKEEPLEAEGVVKELQAM